MRALEQTRRHAPPGRRLGDVPPGTPVALTVVMKPGRLVAAGRHAAGRCIAPEDYAVTHATPEESMGRVLRHAAAHGLRAAEADAARHVIRLEGTYGDTCRAFPPDDIGLYEIEGRPVVARTGRLGLPPALAADVVAVLGLDRRPIARPCLVSAPAPHLRRHAYDPRDVARRYGFPAATGRGQAIALIELGGGFDPADIGRYFAGLGVARTGTLSAVSVDGAPTAPGGARGADGEVQLDIDIAGAVAPDADLRVYFAGNNGHGFYEALHRAVHEQPAPAAISISWSIPETAWTKAGMRAMDALFMQAAALGITVLAASGDGGGIDEQGEAFVEFPASSPYVLACGGTTLPHPHGAEVAWRNAEKRMSGGGGLSAHFRCPPWQRRFAMKWRCVPDVAGNADGRTGYKVRINGQDEVHGGTSAVAPLWAGLVARINECLGTRVGFIHPVLYRAPEAFNDIVAGDNGAYAAGKGLDPVTGLGSPRGAAILAALQAALPRTPARPHPRPAQATAPEA